MHIYIHDIHAYNPEIHIYILYKFVSSTCHVLQEPQDLPAPDFLAAIEEVTAVTRGKLSICKT